MSEKIDQNTFTSHLVELRSRLIKSLIFVFVIFIAGYIFAENIYNFLVEPYAKAVSAKSHSFDWRGNEINTDFNKMIDGIEIVKNDLVSIFKKNGIELIECMDKKFDPNFHQAMLEVIDDKKDAGTVVQEIQKGYMMKDRLLRPSLVGVTKKSLPKEENNATKEEKKLNKD